jgi:hypothetical protein
MLYYYNLLGYSHWTHIAQTVFRFEPKIADDAVKGSVADEPFTASSSILGCMP